MKRPMRSNGLETTGARQRYQCLCEEGQKSNAEISQSFLYIDFGAEACGVSSLERRLARSRASSFEIMKFVEATKPGQMDVEL
jgi:hypothetical protein